MIVGVSIIKDEADIIGWTLAHMTRQGIDRFVIIDNGSTDGTRELLDHSAVTVLDDPDPRFYQGHKITSAVHQHCTEGDWIVPFDADERWAGDHGTLADLFNGTSADVVLGRVWDYLPQADDPAEPDPYKRIGWREQMPEALPVVAFRYHPDLVVGDGNHEVSRPGVRHGGIIVRHLQYRSFEQFARKLRRGKVALEATTLPPSTGAHWRTWGALDDDALHTEWVTLTSQQLVYDPL